MGSLGDLSKILGSAGLQDSDSSDIMVIGIDFGTTNSGVAWATTADFKANQIHVIESWPGIGEEEGKAPTELFYGDGEVKWGFDIPPDAEPLRWFKLLLLKEEDLNRNVRSSHFIQHGRKFLKKTGKSASDLIADYLRLMWGHILYTIKKSCRESVVNAFRFHVVITVPAIWKDYAREGMREAVGRSGILAPRPAGETKFTFAPEPEAAALSTLCEKGRKLYEDEVYVVCDAGGGTVDLISYKIDQVQPISMSEAVEGTGDLCGGIFIDEGFEKLCSNRLGEKWKRLSKRGLKKIMRGEWEHHIKPQFSDPRSDREYIVRIPAEVFKDPSEQNDATREPIITDGRVHFKGSHILNTFAKSVTGIEKLIKEQVQMAEAKYKVVTGIILVGGLGASLFLYESLQKTFGGKNINLLQSGGRNPRTAICRGAVDKGFMDGLSSVGEEWPPKGFQIDMPIKVSSTISRASYGISIRVPFIEGEHLEEDKCFEPDEGELKATNQMKWYLNKGDNVSKVDSVRHSFYCNLADGYDNTHTIKLLQCDEVAPPSRKTEAVKNYVEINCSMESSGLHEWTTVNGRTKKRFQFDLEMVPSGASMDFRVHCNGRVVG